MAKQDVIAYYNEDKFYEGDIEDGLTALLYERDEDGDYVIITDSNGGFPENLDQEIIFAYYREDGTFLWSVTFETSREFREIWRSNGQDGVAAVAAFRSDGRYYEGPAEEGPK
ncbi:MAG TPA: hypothetical protein VN611_14850 [Patescibacteria group bacterium]|nr:hypothetical protein [Patescibacteria group bacterium]